MDSIIVGYFAIFLATWFFLRATLGRYLGVHTPWKWLGGGEIDIAGELGIGGVVLSLGLLALKFPPIWAFVAVLSFLVAFSSRRHANRQYSEKQELVRAANAARYPGVFDQPPLEDFSETHQAIFDLYDVGTCTYLGRVGREDLQTFIIQYLEMTSDLANRGQNDIMTAFSMFDPAELEQEYGISHELASILVENDDLIVRWMPVNDASSVRL